MEAAERPSTPISRYTGEARPHERRAWQAKRSMSFFASYEWSSGRQLEALERDELEHKQQQCPGDAEKVSDAKYGRLVGRLRARHRHLDIGAAGFQQLHQDLTLEPEARARHRDLIEKC